jgi:hypothetical protein
MREVFEQRAERRLVDAGRHQILVRRSVKWCATWSSAGQLTSAGLAGAGTGAKMGRTQRAGAGGLESMMTREEAHVRTGEEGRGEEAAGAGHIWVMVLQQSAEEGLGKFA